MGLSGLTAVAFAQLDKVDMTSSRNQLVLGLSLIMGLSMPHYQRLNKGANWTGNNLFSLSPPNSDNGQTTLTT